MSGREPAYPAECRHHIVEQVRGGRTQAQLAREYECSRAKIRKSAKRAEQEESCAAEGTSGVSERRKLALAQREPQAARGMQDFAKGGGFVCAGKRRVVQETKELKVAEGASRWIMMRRARFTHIAMDEAQIFRRGKSLCLAILFIALPA